MLALSRYSALLNMDFSSTSAQQFSFYQPREGQRRQVSGREREEMERENAAVFIV